MFWNKNKVQEGFKGSQEKHVAYLEKEILSLKKKIQDLNKQLKEKTEYDVPLDGALAEKDALLKIQKELNEQISAYCGRLLKERANVIQASTEVEIVFNEELFRMAYPESDSDISSIVLSCLEQYPVHKSQN